MSESISHTAEVIFSGTVIFWETACAFYSPVTSSILSHPRWSGVGSFNVDVLQIARLTVVREKTSQLERLTGSRHEGRIKTSVQFLLQFEF